MDGISDTVNILFFETYRDTLLRLRKGKTMNIHLSQKHAEHKA